jgi:ABC-2 type transport system ATP-binding protein
MIALESVSKRYGSKTIIRDISFTVGKGEIVGFLGPNGAGKTTTMRMIAGYTTPTSGRVMVAGFDMVTQNEEAARHIGYLPEHPPLYDVMEVTGYLRFVARIKGVPRRSMAADLDRVISACRLEAVVNREIYKLSKGYRQRVGLAQALLGKPDVLLLDEPTAGLDPGQIQETREVIRAFGAEHCVLLSTHILHEVTLICQKVAIIDHGRLLAVDSPSGLQAASEQTNMVTLEATAPANALEAQLRAIEGVSSVVVRPMPGRAALRVECQVQDRDGVEARIAHAVATRWQLHRLERQQPTLENVFLRYVGQPAHRQDGGSNSTTRAASRSPQEPRA